MSFCETPGFYVNIRNGWDLYHRYPSDKTWGYKPLNKVRTINYYRDIEGKYIENVTYQHLRFPCWPKSRLNKGACLPVYYALGQRYIKLQHAPPLGFKCAMAPMSLQEVKDKQVKMELDAQRLKQKKIFEAALKKKCDEKAKKKR